MKKANEKLGREKEEAVREAKEESGKWRKKCENLKVKMSNIELEKVKLESKVSSLSISAEPVAGPSSSSGASGAGGPGLFQDMLDNFRELAETQLQCAVCSELFVEAVSVNCGHTFCHYCIYQWKKKKANCPVCRADIKQIAPCKVSEWYTNTNTSYSTYSNTNVRCWTSTQTNCTISLSRRVGNSRGSC